MELMAIDRFERFFRLVASIDVDKEDLRRFNDFINRKIYDLLVRGEAIAKSNDRDIIQPNDLPITRGLQECIHAFRDINEEIQLSAILDQLTKHPPLDLDYSDETTAQLPEIAGGLGVALARSFKVFDEDVKNPMPRHWDKAFRMFDLLL